MLLIAIPEYRLTNEQDRENNEFTKKYTGEMMDMVCGYRISSRERRDGTGADGVLLSAWGIIARATGETAMECWMELAGKRESMLAN